MVAPEAQLTLLLLTGFTARDNGLAGLDLESATTRVIMSAIISTNIDTTSQPYGLTTTLAAAPNIYLYGGDMHGNATGATNIATSTFGAWQAAQ